LIRMDETSDEEFAECSCMNISNNSNCSNTDGAFNHEANDNNNSNSGSDETGYAAVAYSADKNLNYDLNFVNKNLNCELISRRALRTAGPSSCVTNFMFTARSRWSQNAFDEIENPGGIVNLGTAENKVGTQILNSKIAEITDKILKSNVNILNYADNRGIRSVREKVAKFLDEYFVATHRHCAKPKFSVDPDQLVITNGCGPSLDLLAHVLADEGDVILSPTPHYKRIQNNFQERELVQTVHLPLSSEDNWTLSLDHIKKGYEEATAMGKRVRALVLINPHNPLGSILDKGTLWSILQFCRDKKIHVIFDEIYRLCIFKGCLREFTSILQFGKNIPDPERTHFVWSMSKDFGMSGFRFGVVYTHSSAVAKALSCFAYFSTISSMTQQIVGEMLSDYQWIDKVYLPYCQKQIQDRLSLSTSALEKIGVKIHSESKAGLYIWAFVGDFLPENTFEEERRFTQHLMENCGCYVMPGCELDCPEPGWVRIVFTVSTKELEVFLDRFCAALRAERGDVEEEAEEEEEDGKMEGEEGGRASLREGQVEKEEAEGGGGEINISRETDAEEKTDAREETDAGIVVKEEAGGGAEIEGEEGATEEEGVEGEEGEEKSKNRELSESTFDQIYTEENDTESENQARPAAHDKNHNNETRKSLPSKQEKVAKSVKKAKMNSKASKPEETGKRRAKFNFVEKTGAEEIPRNWQYFE